MRGQIRSWCLAVATVSVSACISTAAYAEYYLVYPDQMMMANTMVSCDSPCMKYRCQPVYHHVGYVSPPIHYMSFHSPKRHNPSYGTDEAESYAWIPTP